MSRMRRALSAFLLIALVVSLGAECFVSDEMNAAQMACCAAMGHDCEAAGPIEDCCRSEGGDQPQLVAKAQQPLTPPALVASLPELDVPIKTQTFVSLDIESTRLVADSPPKYILLATFLI
ncbi:MAG: hypothetical protein AB7N65_23650 [Vicinamibacterales bacterium]